MIKLYIIGASILLTAILANIFASLININTWYNFSNTILENKSFLKALKQQNALNLIWLFLIYPLILGFGYIIAQTLINFFSNEAG